MNALTINLHLLLISFYRPTKERYKILLESHAFPSDHYAIESQIKLHNLNPDDCMVYVKPREGEQTIRMEDIVATIKKEGSSIAVIMLSGVQYYTGQLFDMKEITKLGHEMGCYVGFDLAHAIGNVPMSMHAWDVDFACWCTYKYLCSGAGSLGGLYVHEKFDKANLPKLHGWWSHKIETRFVMDNVLDVCPGALAYRISNPSGILSACLLASLEVFDEVDMVEYRNKSLLMSAYFEYLVMSSRYYDKKDAQAQNNHHNESHDPFPKIKIITPLDPNERGCQFSIVFSDAQYFIPIFKEISARGVVLDKREPNSLRFSFNPFYNRFVDIFNFIETLETSIESILKI